jgi:signal transduction histidine kinase
VALPRVLRTATFRLALLYAVLFGISAVVLFTTLYWSMTGYATQQIRVAIKAEVASLVDNARNQGIGHLAQTIKQRLGGPDQHSSYYLLLDATGQQIAGNIPTMTPIAGWREFGAPESDGGDEGEEDENRTILGFGLLLPRGGFLLVGHDTEQLRELRELIIRAFSWAGGVTVGLALLGGATLSLGFLRRLEAFNRTSGRIIEGNLTERVPVRGSDDEFDRLARNINRMLDQIQELIEGLRQVSNDIAHDLRTPLAHLRRGIETARRKARSVTEYKEAFDQAIAETDEILATFGALLRIAQIEAGTKRAGFATVDLSAVFDTIVETYTAVAEDHGQTLSSRIAPGVTIRGDRELLTQLLANLVDNAIRHTPAGTMVEVLLGVDQYRPIGVVADTGPGVPAEAREKIFRRFYRLDRSRTTTGSGLGLSLVAAVAELHGIAITLADNAPGLRVALDFTPKPFARPQRSSGRRQENGR